MSSRELCGALSRRHLLTASSGLMLGITAAGSIMLVEASDRAESVLLNAYVSIGDDGKITIAAHDCRRRIGCGLARGAHCDCRHRCRAFRFSVCGRVALGTHAVG